MFSWVLGIIERQCLLQWLRVCRCQFQMLNGPAEASRSPARDVGHAGLYPHTHARPLPWKRAHSFLQRRLSWSTGDSGRGAAYPRACNIFSSRAGMLNLGWGGHFSVFTILLFLWVFLFCFSKRRISIQMNCVAQKWGKRRREQLFSSFSLNPFAASRGLKAPDLPTLSLSFSGVICFPHPSQTSSSSSFCSELWKFNLRFVFCFFFTVQRIQTVDSNTFFFK